jgi:hypothetical protein
VVALVVGLGTGSAFAYFGAPMHHSGAADAGTAQAITVVASQGTAGGNLYPGTTADLDVDLDNPNSFPVHVVTVSGDGPVTSAGGIGICTTTGVTVPAQAGLSIAVPPGADVVVHIPNGVAMGASSSSGCQGATFSVPVILRVQQQ